MVTWESYHQVIHTRHTFPWKKSPFPPCWTIVYAESHTDLGPETLLDPTPSRRLGEIHTIARQTAVTRDTQHVQCSARKTEAYHKAWYGSFSVRLICKAIRLLILPSQESTYLINRGVIPRAHQWQWEYFLLQQIKMERGGGLEGLTHLAGIAEYGSAEQQVKMRCSTPRSQLIVWFLSNPIHWWFFKCLFSEATKHSCSSVKINTCHSLTKQTDQKRNIHWPNKLTKKEIHTSKQEIVYQTIKTNNIAYQTM